MISVDKHYCTQVADKGYKRAIGILPTGEREEIVIPCGDVDLYGQPLHTHSCISMLCSGMFLEFLEAEPTVENVICFANRYGLIEEKMWKIQGQSVMTLGTSTSTWYSKARQLRSAWECWQGRDKNGPSIIRENIEKNINLNLGCFVEMVANVGVDRLQVVVRPKGLLGVLWLQMSMAINGNKQFDRCKQCGRPFERKSDAARSRKVFCCANCRVKHYRSKKG